MAITPTAPKTVPATPEKVFDKMWLDHLVINAKVTSNVSVRFELVPCRDLEDGSVEVDRAAQPIVCTVANVMQLAQSDAELATLIGMILAKVDSIAKAQGKI